MIQYYVYEEFNHSVLREVVVRGLVFIVLLGLSLSFYALAENATGRVFIAANENGLLDSGENGSRRRSALCGVRRRRPRKRMPALVRRHGSQHQGLEMVVCIVVHSGVGAHPKTTCWIPFVREWGGGSL